MSIKLCQNSISIHNYVYSIVKTFNIFENNKYNCFNKMYLCDIL